MNNFDLTIKNTFAYYRKQINFLEDYYGKKVESYTSRPLKIELDFDSNTSYYSPFWNKIFISTKNLRKIYIYFPKLFYSLFYTLILHEIGHALYTGRNFQRFTDMLNILEDNRTEYLTSKWNRRVRFDLFRFLYQDITFIEVGKITSKSSLALALLRTVNNKPFVALIGGTPERDQILDQIFKLADLYKKKDYELPKLPPSFTEELESLSDEISALFDKLIKDYNEDNPPQQSESGRDDSEEQEQSDSEEQEQNDESENDSEDEQEDKEQESETEPNSMEESEDEQDNGKSTKSEPTEEEMEQQELEEELQKAKEKGQTLEPILNNGMGTLVNDMFPEERYEPIKISAFTTARRRGIKGSKKVKKQSGSLRDFNARRYSQSEFNPTETEFFDRYMNIKGKGGKVGSVVFYLDVSTSMLEGSKVQDYSHKDKLYWATLYLKSFYDAMHKHLNIRLMAFGKHTYKLTRKELNYKYLRNIAEGSTRPKAIKVERDEEVVFVTDGVFDTELPERFKKKGHFVMIDIPEWIQKEYFSDYKNIYNVHKYDILRGLEKATKGIKQLLRR